MDKVKELIKAGASIPTAIKESLGMSQTAFADKYDLPRSVANEVINGTRPATDKVVEALRAELGGELDEWREVLRQARLAKAAA